MVGTELYSQGLGPYLEGEVSRIAVEACKRGRLIAGSSITVVSREHDCRTCRSSNQLNSLAAQL